MPMSIPERYADLKAWGANTSLGQSYIQRKIDQAVESGEVPASPTNQDPRIREAVMKAFTDWQKDPEHQQKLVGALPKLLKKKLDALFGE